MSAMPDKMIADPEQVIADLQRQLAECKAERDEALQQQTAAAEVLQVINSFHRLRCLVPVDGFYEWKKTGTGKQPSAIALADRGLMALAGL